MKELFTELTASEANSVAGGYKYGVAYVPGGNKNYLTNAFAEASAKGNSLDPNAFTTTYATADTSRPSDSGPESIAVSQTTVSYSEVPL